MWESVPILTVEVLWMVGTMLQTLNVTIELVKQGYTKEEIALLWGQSFSGIG